MMDDYDRQIEHLLQHPLETTKQWLSGKGVFRFATVSGTNIREGTDCGCLTMIRDRPKVFRAPTPELTRKIYEDERLPTNVDEATTRQQLEVMAEWQRRLDKELNREPYAFR
jgi:hypothetical protein